MPTHFLYRSTHLFLALLTAYLLTSCSLFGDSPPVSQDGVIARDVGDAIVIENRRSAPIWADLYTTGFLSKLILARPLISRRLDSARRHQVNSTGQHRGHPRHLGRRGRQRHPHLVVRGGISQRRARAPGRLQRVHPGAMRGQPWLNLQQTHGPSRKRAWTARGRCRNGFVSPALRRPSTRD